VKIDKYDHLTLARMSHYAVLVFTVTLAAFSPMLSPLIGLEVNSFVLLVILVGLFLQELFVIQITKRQENIAFTRRFYRYYPPGKTYFVRYSSSIFAAFILFSLLLLSDFELSKKHVIFYLCVPMSAKFLYEPLLGTYLHENKKTIQYIFAYFVINIFALTSSLSPAETTLIPNNYIQSYVIVMTIGTLLTLRLAYYESFCLNNMSRLETQLSHVLVALLLLSLPNLLKLGELLLGELR
jgi:hypothetical protein